MKNGLNPLVATLAAAWLVFTAACSPNDAVAPAAVTESAAQDAVADGATVGEAPRQASVTDADQLPAAQEISEIEGQQETVEDSPVTTGTLRLRDLSPLGTAQAQPSRFQQGVNYKPLVPAQPTSVSPGQVEAVEIFWYGCPHCFALDPSVESWRKSGKAPYVQFVRVPAMWNDMLKTHARLFYTVEALGKLEELHPIIFREINVNRNLLDNTDKIIAFLGQHGVTADEYKKAANSFAVEAKLRRAEELNRRYRVQGVPMVVINGKYTADVGSAGGNQQLLQLIDEVAARERG